MANATDVYRREAVLSMPKEDLLLRILGALLLRIDEAEAALASGDRARAGRAISRAFDIVNALREALDPGAGADCVPQLDRIYRTVSAWLLEANLTRSTELLHSSRRVLACIKEGFDGAAASTR